MTYTLFCLDYIDKNLTNGVIVEGAAPKISETVEIFNKFYTVCDIRHTIYAKDADYHSDIEVYLELLCET